MPDAPKRIQLRRTKGWRLPEGAINCARPTIYGNPFRVDGDWITWAAVALGYRGDKKGRTEAAAALHRAWLTDTPVILGPLAGEPVDSAIEFSNGHVVSVSEHARQWALFAATRLFEPPKVPDTPPDLEPLRGHDLGCFCALDAPCHVNVLLEAANA